jgi:hypothetical protein
MKRAEIIEAAVQKARESNAKTTEWTGPGRSYENYLLATLKRKFSQVDDDTEVLTCPNFERIGVECCSVFHYEYPDEPKLIQLRSGSYAWNCCAVERAIGSTVQGQEADHYSIIRRKPQE